MPASRSAAAPEEAEEAEQPVVTRPTPITCSAAYTGREPIAQARNLARRFLTDLQDLHLLPVSDRGREDVELVVSELITNTRKYAPGPSRLHLEARDGCVEVTVWDSNPTPPTLLPPDPLRIGQQGLGIVVGIAQTFTIEHAPGGKRITATIALTDS